MAEKKTREITTIKIEKETKMRLDRLKEHKRESYEEILKKILGILNIIKADPEKAAGILDKIDKSSSLKHRYTEVYIAEREKQQEILQNKLSKNNIPKKFIK